MWLRRPWLSTHGNRTMNSSPTPPCSMTGKAIVNAWPPSTYVRYWVRRSVPRRLLFSNQPPQHVIYGHWPMVGYLPTPGLLGTMTTWITLPGTSVGRPSLCDSMNARWMTSVGHCYGPLITCTPSVHRSTTSYKTQPSQPPIGCVIRCLVRLRLIGSFVPHFTPTVGTLRVA